MNDHRRQSPAAARNREPILDLLRSVLPETGTVLEVASGTGEHVIHFARALPRLTWQSTDADPEALASIEAWRAEQSLSNLLAPVCVDAAALEWNIAPVDAVICINMIHISPWEATIGLMHGAAKVLPIGGPLILYGPYRRSGRPLEASNALFDASLRERDPRWGLRELDAVGALAAEHGLALEDVHDMPANNLSVVFRRV